MATPPPGYYRNPADPIAQERFWDGRRWTDQTRLRVFDHDVPPPGKGGKVAPPAPAVPADPVDPRPVVHDGPPRRISRFVDNFLGEFLDDVNERMETPFDPSQQTSWCRFRDGRGHCMYPEELDEAGTNRAGYAVFVPFDRGYCKRGWNEQQHCEVAEPGPDSGHPNPYPDGTRSYDQGGQRWR